MTVVVDIMADANFFVANAQGNVNRPIYNTIKCDKMQTKLSLIYCIFKEYHMSKSAVVLNISSTMICPQPQDCR